MPERVRVFGLQEKLVEIRDSSDPLLRSMGRDKTVLPFAELRRVYQERHVASVRYVSDGQEITAVAAAPDDPLNQPLSLLDRNLWWFRSFPADQPVDCLH